ncbi:MAG TPA: nucleotidyltransferase family protein [Candidatus Limnocylindrales bacterium]|nr:nucleotidyltransferase family protein [Candidatus Limnocylindrales bacterium]
MSGISNKISIWGIRPEVELLLDCARTHMDPERAERIKRISQEGLDWDYLLRTALLHRTTPLLYWHLNILCPEVVPKTILDQLRDFFHGNVRRNLFLTGELLKLLSLLEVHKITAIPYKGPILALSAYGNLAFRHFDDLDILIRKQDILKAKDLLISQGYRPKYPFFSTREEAYLEFHRQLPFTRDDGIGVVELHTATTQKYLSFPDPESLWSRLTPVSFQGTQVLTLSSEDLLLILCIHGAKHLWERIGWICDIAELIRTHPDIDWEWTLEQARTLGGERALLLGLYLATDLLGTSLPQEISQKLSDPVVKNLARRLSNKLLQKSNPRPGIFEPSLFQPLYLQMRERLQDRVRYGLYLPYLAITPTREDHQFLPLPASFFFLYYLIRPIRLTGKYFWRLFRRLL